MSSTNSCCQPGPELNHTPNGRVTIIAGRPAYISTPPTSTHSDDAIVMCTDVFGHLYLHNQQNADYLAATTGMTVIVPDPFKTAVLPTDFFQVHGATAFQKFQTEWIPLNSPQDALTIVRSVVQELSKQYKRVHGIGYCYGVYPCYHLACEGALHSGAGAHPSFLKPEDTQTYNRPFLFLCAEQDQAFTPELRGKFEKELTEKGAKFIVYPGTSHGFAARGDASVQPQRVQAHDDAAQFFVSHSKA